MSRKPRKGLRLRARWRSENEYFRFGTITTGAILLATLALAFGTVSTPGRPDKIRWKAFLEAPPNEIGDTIAGLAGTLAFLWIIVTVMIQGRELRLQRRELILTRQELKAQRKAAEEMAKAQSAQVEVLQEQATIIADEKRHRSESEAGDLFRSMLQEFVAFCKNHPPVQWRIRRPENNLASTIQPQWIPTEAQPRRSTVEEPISLLYMGRNSSHDTEMLVKLNVKSILSVKPRLLLVPQHAELLAMPIEPLKSYGLLEKLTALCDAETKLSLADQVKMGLLDLKHALRCYQEICNMPVWKPIVSDSEEGALP